MDCFSEPAQPGDTKTSFGHGLKPSISKWGKFYPKNLSKLEGKSYPKN